MVRHLSVKNLFFLLTVFLSLTLCFSNAWSARRVDRDGDGFRGKKDCNDQDPTIYRGAPEIANDGIDQDCNGSDLVVDTETPPDEPQDETMPHIGLRFDDYPNNCL